MAVGSPRGLVVPVIRNADLLSLADIEETVADFGKRAQEGKAGSTTDRRHLPISTAAPLAR